MKQNPLRKRAEKSFEHEKSNGVSRGCNPEGDNHDKPYMRKST